MDNDTRIHRYRGRYALRQVTDIPRCADCGRATITPGGAVGVRHADGVAGFAGLATCGRIWVCPVCNSKVMARRALDLGLAVTWAAAHDYRLIWGSLTVRHDARSDLAQLLDIQRDAWRHVVSQKGWRAESTSATVQHSHTDACFFDCDRKRDVVDIPGRLGRVGYVRAAEITIGLNGWHPHFHPMLVYRGSRSDAADHAASIVSDWLEGVRRAGGSAIGQGSQQLKVLSPEEYTRELAGYMTKATYDGASMALEVAWSQGKTGTGSRGRKRALGTRAHWSLLHDIATDTGEVTEALTRWWELEAATRGHRMLTWSRGLRSFVGLGAESTDEEEAATEIGTDDDTVCYITPEGWASVRDNPDAVAGILATLEASGWAGLRDYLDSWGIAYFVLDAARS